MTASKCILVVDDDEGIREVVDMALSDEGYKVLTAGHGGVALRLVENAKPDLILLDVRMPVMDGCEFSRAYHRLPGPHAPVVLLTAADEPLDALTTIDAVGFLAKPFDLDELVALVRRYTERR